MHKIRTIAEKPIIILLIILILTGIGIGAIAKNAKLETDLNEYMPSTHPAFAFSDEAEALFGIEDMILIAIEHPVSIFNEGTLTKIRDITMDLPQSFPEISEGTVTSLYTADNITGSDWGLEVESFYSDGVPNTAEELQEMQDKVVSNEMIYGRNVSKDATATLIIAEIDPESDSQDLQKRLKAYAQQWEGPETIYIAGRPIVEGALAELGPADMARMFPIVMVVMIGVLLLLLRSIRDTIINMIIVLIGTVAAFGGMALFGVPVYAVDTMIPVMLIAIGVAYGIHMHNAIHHAIQQNPAIQKRELVDTVLKAMVRPVFMAALTTAIGFFALMTSQVLPVRYFGLFSAIGVMTEMVLALLLFPASIYLLGIPKKGKETVDEMVDDEEKSPWYGKNGWGRFIMKKPALIVVIAIGIAAFGVFGTQKVWIDTSFLANFEEDSEIVVTDNFVNTKFGGTSSLNVILTAEEEQVFKDPAILQAMDRMQSDILEDPMVGAAFSLTDFIKRMNKVMNEDDEAFSRIPDERELVAQYLLLYEFSGDPETLETVIDYEYMNANITFQLKSDSSAVMSDIIAVIETHRSSFESLGVTVRYAGCGYKAFVFSELLLEGQIVSLVLSFGIVALLLALLFKNILIGIVGTIPIAITAVVNFGVMGLFDIPLSSATALISSIAVGIGVDYAIHLIEHYRNRRLEDFTIREATFATIRHTGRAIIYNAIAVMGGFAVLVFSVFPPNRQVGTLIVLNMATSAIGTLSILLVTIIALDKRGKFIRNTTAIRPTETIRQEDTTV
jgi:hydrophobe/amphiphile efflux-3 (HAE3) family protein